MSAFVKFWGARGSIPTPGGWTRTYGGNTSCVEVRFGESVFICDAGSGIRELGKDLMQRSQRPKELHLLITHTHWDHIQGFPFFVPAYLKESRIRVYGSPDGDNDRQQVLSGQMSSAYFPVSFKDLRAEIIPDTLGEDDSRVIEGVKVSSFELNHPGGCLGYSFEQEGRKIVYATDNELTLQEGDTFPDPKHKGGLRSVSQELIDAVSGADLLITDSQYTDEAYADKIGWGHSSCFSVTDFAIQAGAKNLALFHHDPESADRDVDAMVDSCRARAVARGSEMTIFASREGLELKF